MVEFLFLLPCPTVTLCTTKKPQNRSLCSVYTHNCISSFAEKSSCSSLHPDPLKLSHQDLTAPFGRASSMPTKWWNFSPVHILCLVTANLWMRWASVWSCSQLSGTFLYFSNFFFQLLPAMLTISGRLAPEFVTDYLEKLKFSYNNQRVSCFNH